MPGGSIPTSGFLTDASPRARRWAMSARAPAKSACSERAVSLSFTVRSARAARLRHRHSHCACRRSDFKIPVIREVIAGTLAACKRHFARNFRDIKGRARPILRYLPLGAAESEGQAEDLADYFRSALAAKDSRDP